MDRHTTIHTYTYSQLKVSNSPHVYGFGLRQEAGEPGEDLHRHRENVQIPHRKVADPESNPQPVTCCEAAPLTTVSPTLFH